MPFNSDYEDFKKIQGLNNPKPMKTWDDMAKDPDEQDIQAEKNKPIREDADKEKTRSKLEQAQIDESNALADAALWEIVGGGARVAQAYGTAFGSAMTAGMRALSSIGTMISYPIFKMLGKEKEVVDEWSRRDKFWKDNGITKDQLIVKGNPIKDPKVLLDPAYYAQLLGEQLPNAAFSFGIGGALSSGATGWLARLGAAVCGGLVPSIAEAHGTADEMRLKGASEEDAFNAMQLHALYIVGTNALTLDKWLRLNGGKGLVTTLAMEGIGEMSEETAGAMIETGLGYGSWQEIMEATKNSVNVLPATLIYGLLMNGMSGVQSFTPTTVKEEIAKQKLLTYMEEEIKANDAKAKQAKLDGKQLDVNDLMMDVVRESSVENSENVGLKDIINKQSKKYKVEKAYTVPMQKDAIDVADEATKSITGVKYMLGAVRNRVDNAVNTAKDIVDVSYKWIYPRTVGKFGRLIDIYWFAHKFDPTLSKNGKSVAERAIRGFLAEAQKQNKYANIVYNDIVNAVSEIAGKDWNKMTKDEKNDISIKLLKYMENPTKNADILTDEQKKLADKIMDNSDNYVGVNKAQTKQRLAKRLASKMRIKGIGKYSEEQIAAAIEYNSMPDVVKNQFKLDPENAPIVELAENIMVKPSETMAYGQAHKVDAVFPNTKTNEAIYEAIDNDRTKASGVVNTMNKQGMLPPDVYENVRNLVKLGDYSSAINTIEQSIDPNNTEAMAKLEELKAYSQKIDANIQAIQDLEEYGDDMRYVPRYMTKESKSESFRSKLKRISSGKRRAQLKSDLTRVKQEGKDRVYLWNIDEMLPQESRDKVLRNVPDIFTLKILQDGQRAALDDLIGGLMEAEGVFKSNADIATMEENGDPITAEYMPLTTKSSNPSVVALLDAYPELEGLNIHKGIMSAIEQKSMEIEGNVVQEGASAILNQINRIGNLGIHLFLMNPLYMYRINTEQQFITAPGAIPETFNVIESFYKNPEQYAKDFKLALETFMITGNSPIAERISSGSYDIMTKAKEYNEASSVLEKVITKSMNPKHVNNPAWLKVLRASFEMPRSVTFDYIDTWQKIAVTNVLRTEAYNQYDNALRKIDKMDISDEAKAQAKLEWIKKHTDRDAYAKEYIMNKSQKYGTVEWMGDYSRVPEFTKKLLTPLWAFYQLRLSTFTALGKNIGADISQTTEDIQSLSSFLNKKEYANMGMEELMAELENNNKSQSLKTLGRFSALVLADFAKYMLSGYTLDKYYRWRKSQTLDDVMVYKLLREDTQMRRILPDPEDFNNYMAQYRDYDVPVMNALSKFSGMIDKIDRSGADVRKDMLKQLGDAIMSQSEKEYKKIFGEAEMKEYPNIMMGANTAVVPMGVHTYPQKLAGKGFDALLPIDSPIAYLVKEFTKAQTEDITIFDRGTVTTLYSQKENNPFEAVKAIAKKYGMDYTNFGNIYKLMNDPSLTDEEKWSVGLGGFVFMYNKQGKTVRQIVNNYKSYITHPYVYSNIAYKQDKDGEWIDRHAEEQSVLKTLAWGMALADKQGVGDGRFLEAFKDMYSLDRDGNTDKAIFTDKEINDFIQQSREAFRNTDYLNRKEIYNSYTFAQDRAKRENWAPEYAREFTINEMATSIQEYFDKYGKIMDMENIGRSGNQSPYAYAEQIYEELERMSSEYRELLEEDEPTENTGANMPPVNTGNPMMDDFEIFKKLGNQ